jgi:hypothetical protein
MNTNIIFIPHIQFIKSCTEKMQNGRNEGRGKILHNQNRCEKNVSLHYESDVLCMPVVGNVMGGKLAAYCEAV